MGPSVVPGTPELVVNPALQVVYGHWRTMYHLAAQHDHELYQELQENILLGRRPFYYGEHIGEPSLILQSRQAFVLSPGQLADDELAALRAAWSTALEQGSFEGRFAIEYDDNREVRIIFAKALAGIE